MSHRSILLVVCLISLALVAAAPPTPHSIAGYIHRSDNRTQVPIGTSYSIHDITNPYVLRGATSNPVPGMTGSYFETIQAVDGDIVVVRAWNATMYGITNASMRRRTEGVNLSIRRQRTVELNMTLLVPASGASYGIGSAVNITARVGVLGADGHACNVTLLLSPAGVMNLSSGQDPVRSLGDPSRGAAFELEWNATALADGRVNVTVKADCADDALYLEAAPNATAYNVWVRDILPPVVRAVSPANNSVYRGPAGLLLYYNVTDNSAIDNCTLSIDGSRYAVNSTRIRKGARLNFSVSLPNGLHAWRVNCSDMYGNMGSAGSMNLSVLIYAPRVSSLDVPSSVVLNAGSTVAVRCNATVSDGNGASDIARVNATLYQVGAPASLDNNYRYNASCASIPDTGYSLNVSCLFSLWYYADNGSWRCNVSGYDAWGMANSSAAAAVVEELYAIGVDPSLDFGAVPPAMVSDDSQFILYNHGNRDINVSVFGYGATLSDGLSMDCLHDGNISVDELRYAHAAGSAFTSMTPLTAAPIAIMRILQRRTDDTGYGASINTTYWQLRTPSAVKGQCSGVLVFSAEHP